jgi:hypothetical protein
MTIQTIRANERSTPQGLSRPILRLPRRVPAAVPVATIPPPQPAQRPGADPGKPTGDLARSGQALPVTAPALVAARWLRTLPAFDRPRRPLAIGIHRDLIAVAPEGISARSLRKALADWTRHHAYQSALAEPGSARIGLDGNPVAPVTEAHRAHVAALLAQKHPTEGVT